MAVSDAPVERWTGARTRGGQDDYLRELQSQFQLDLAGTRVLLDCANGATYRAAPLLFERLGAQVDVMAAEPNGTNINAGCGSTHMEPLVDRMREGGHDIGFAFDGDGDRVLAVDRNGRLSTETRSSPTRPCI